MKLSDISNQRIEDILRCPRCGKQYPCRSWFGETVYETDTFREKTFVCKSCWSLYEMETGPSNVLVTPVRLLMTTVVDELGFPAGYSMVKCYSFDHLKSLFMKED